MLSIMAVTNKDYCMINALVATTPDGTEYVFDRDMTEYSINNGVLIMNWYGVYLWDGEEPTYIDIDSQAFRDVVTNAEFSFELEEDAEEDYRVTDITLYF